MWIVSNSYIHIKHSFSGITYLIFVAERVTDNYILEKPDRLRICSQISEALRGISALKIDVAH